MNDLLQPPDGLLTIRPIQATDVEPLARMFRGLSHETVYYRFFTPLPTIPTSVLNRMVEVDHRSRDALVALDGDDIVAVASYDGIEAPSRGAELAVVVDDTWQRRGVGLRLTRLVARLAVGRGHRTLVARMLPSNHAAVAMIRTLSPHASVTFVDGELEAQIALDDVMTDRAPAAADVDVERVDLRLGARRGAHRRRIVLSAG